MTDKIKLYTRFIAFLIANIFVFNACQEKTESKTDTLAKLPPTSEIGIKDVKEIHLNEAQYQTINIVLGSFELKNLSNVIQTNGYTKLPPQNQAQVSTPLPGTIKTIKVIEGQYVKMGQILSTVQSMAYNNLRLEREKLIEQKQQSEENLAYLQLEYAREKELTEGNVTAKMVFQKISSEVRLEEIKIKALQNQIHILSQNVEIGGNSDSPIINILAPMNGYITEVGINIGSAVEVGKPLFTIVDNTKMHVDLLVYEKDLYDVKQGQIVRFILTNRNAAELKGRIFSVGKSFKNDTKSVAVHADIANENQTLIPGMYVNALIDVGSKEVRALPQEAVVKAEGREFIFILEGKENGEYHFQRIEVKTDAAQLGFVATTPLQDLKTAKNIVVKGAYYLQSHLQMSESSSSGHEH